jgi:prepilin signal peptidase PulO-like enzyme (type II secretory pathway)
MIDWAFYVFVFIFGTIIGSFLNVVILRFGTGRTLGGRSACMSCRAQLRWFELIPVFSFFVQRGRCRTCSTSMSIQYPLVEALVGLLYVAAFSVATSYEYLAASVVMIPLLVAIAVYDLRHMRIPTLWNYLWVATACVYGVYTFGVGMMITACILPVLFFAVWFFSNGRALGFGDVIFSIGSALSLGFLSSVFATWIASMIGAVYGIAVLLVDRRDTTREQSVTLSTAVPFGPFLVTGVLVMWLCGPYIIGTISAFLYGM